MVDLGNSFRRVSRILAAPLVERGYRPDPVYLFLELNRRCNHRCVMCGIWKEQTDGMPVEQIRRIFSVSFFQKLERVILAGGEPMMRKDLVEVADFFLRQLPRLRAMAILTNGFNTARTMEVAEGILDLMDRQPGRARHLAMQISLDAMGEEYDRIRGIKHAWTRTHDTVQRLSALQRTRPHLGLMLHVVIQPQNLHQLDAIDAFAREFEAPVIFSPAVISDTYFSNREQAAELSLSDEQRAVVKQFILNRREVFTEAMPFYYQDIAKMLDGAERSRKCMMGYHHMYVKMNGQVFPCVNSGDHVLGDLTTQPPEEVWRGKHADASRRTIRNEFCPTCTSACDNDITTIKEMAIHLKGKLLRPKPT